MALANLVGGYGKYIDTVGGFFGDILPELNISEKLESYGAQAVPAEQRVARVQQDSRFPSGIPEAASGRTEAYPNLAAVPDQPAYANTFSTSQSPSNENGTDTSGAGVNGGTGSGGAGSSGNSGNSAYDQQQAYWQNMLNQQNAVMQKWMAREEAAKEAQKQAAKSAYNEVLRQSEQMKTSAQGKYGTNVGDINSRYDELDKRIADSIGNLNTNQASKLSSIEDSFNQVRMQQIAAKNKADTQNRNLARAMNRGDSSFFEDIMSGNIDDAAAVLDALLANRTSSKEDLDNQYQQTLTSLNNQQADTQSERSNMLASALDEYNAAVETATQLASQGLIDYNSAMAGIQSNLANNLLTAASQQQSNSLNNASILAAFQGALGNLGQVNTSLSGVNSSIPTNLANAIGNLQLLNQVDNTGNNALANLMSMSNKSKTERFGV